MEKRRRLYRKKRKKLIPVIGRESTAPSLSKLSLPASIDSQGLSTKIVIKDKGEQSVTDSLIIDLNRRLKILNDLVNDLAPDNKGRTAAQHAYRSVEIGPSLKGVLANRILKGLESLGVEPKRKVAAPQRKIIGRSVVTILLNALLELFYCDLELRTGKSGSIADTADEHRSATIGTFPHVIGYRGTAPGTNKVESLLRHRSPLMI